MESSATENFKNARIRTRHIPKFNVVTVLVHQDTYSMGTAVAVLDAQDFMANILVSTNQIHVRTRLHSEQNIWLWAMNMHDNLA